MSNPQLFFKEAAAELTRSVEDFNMAASASIKKDLIQHLKERFKKGKGSSGAFFKAVKVYNFPHRSDGRNPVSYVRLGVPWMDIFEEGGNISKGIIRLPPAISLGWPRATKKNWPSIWAKIKLKGWVAKSTTGTVIGIKQGKKRIPLYKIQKNIRINKRIDFYSIANQAFTKIQLVDI